jgi:YHS domain-containing protein
MDPESIKSLLSFLLWGGLFFLMMRYGCGAHIMGGHGKHGGHGKTDDTAGSQAKDPVCGMAVDPGKAAGASVHAGKTYYFCSASCRDKFEKEPAKYAAAPARDENQHGGHHHG